MFIHKLFTSILCCFCTMVLTANIDVQISDNATESNCQDNQYCIDIRLRSVDEDILLGHSSIRFNYDATVLKFEGSTDNQNIGSYISKAFDESTNCGIINPYKAHSFDGLTHGDFLISIILLSTFVQDCTQPLNSDWTTLSTICFEVLDPTKNPQFEVSGSENGAPLNTAATNFNRHTNDALDKPNNGSFSETELSFHSLCGITTGIETFPSNNSLNSIKIQPIPVKDLFVLTLTSNDEKEATIQIFDINGKLTKTEQINLSTGINQFKIDAADYVSGSYIISINSGKIFLREMFIKD